MKMKRLKFLMFVVLVAFGTIPCGEGRAGTPSDDLEDVVNNTQTFDDGPGSTLNTSPGVTHPVGEVPEVGEPVEVEESGTSTSQVKKSTPTATVETPDTEENAEKAGSVEEEKGVNDETETDTNTTDTAKE